MLKVYGENLFLRTPCHLLHFVLFNYLEKKNVSLKDIDAYIANKCSERNFDLFIQSCLKLYCTTDKN